MFAVPGWSVSSDVKRQTNESSKISKNLAGSIVKSEEGAKSGKKRKRGSEKSKASDVNIANVAELYETVIEGKPKVKSKEPSEKRQKVSLDGAEDAEGSGVPVKVKGEKQEKKKPDKTKKEKRREKKLREQVEDAVDVKDQPSKEAQKVTKAEPKPPSKQAPTLTPLQASMRQKLVSARFRHLNQQLYTTPSTQSLSLFEQNPEMFTEYHEGFRRQVEVWPENPVDGYIHIIKSRGKIRGPSRHSNKSTSETPDPTIVPLPRTDGTCHIADLGCGDAALAASLQNDSKKLHLKIHSFDLYSPSPLVTRADISSLPLPDASIDVAIFCLALMGTNWIDFIEEAFRILRWKGELWIAEIKSRFGRLSGSKGKVVSHSVGYRQKKQAPPPSKKEKQKAFEEEAKLDNTALMVEVDENDDAKQETDLISFIEVLRKRGFLLKGPEAPGEKPIDLSNKMFVRMHFVKSQTPMKGKCVPVPKGMSEMGLETWQKKKPKKFLEGDGEGDETPVSSEAGVLKPCVYKLR